MIPISPFRIEVPQDTLDDLRERLRRTRWPEQVSGTGWSRGIDLDYMKELVRYWADEFDWRKQEERLNRLPHFLADFDGLRLHFIHQPGNGPAPLPLFMMHGYPWSFVLLERILPMLTDPASHGGDPRDAFTVIVPSIIGFGYSAYPPQQGFGFQHHPRIYDRLMTEGLGYARYGIEGGYWGGFLTAPWGYLHPQNLIGIHLNCLFPRLGDEREREDKDPDILRGLGMKWAPVKPKDPDMLRYWKNVERYWIDEGAYCHQQMTRPQTLAIGMSDSPAGLAAWIIEKWRAWSGWGDDFEKLFPRDMLLTNVMLYWVTNSFWSSIRLYSESYYHPWELPAGERIQVPTAVAAYPHELAPIVRKRAERYYNVVHYHDYPQGGHFAIHERAEEMAADLREFFRPLRKDVR